MKSDKLYKSKILIPGIPHSCACVVAPTKQIESDEVLKDKTCYTKTFSTLSYIFSPKHIYIFVIKSYLLTLDHLLLETNVFSLF